MKEYILTCETALDIQTKLKKRADWKLKVTIELKNALTHKMRLPVWGYTNGEHLYMLVNGGLMLKYKTYTITSQEDALEAWKIQEKELVLTQNLAFGWKKKTKGGFLPILGSLAKPLLISASGAIGKRKIEEKEDWKTRLKRRRRIRRLSYA